MEQLNVFHEKFYNLIKDGVNFVQLQSTMLEDVLPEKVEWTQHKNTSHLSCSYCRVEFETVIQQREHYKLDWHRYNLKQHLLCRQPVTEEEFSNKADDVSSISGSDSSDEDTIDTIATAQGKIFLKNANGLVFSLYKCLIADKKEELKDDNDLLRRLISANQNLQWTVLMLGGGHFAGAIFKGSEAILHKTFHSYTVRQGQGGSQNSRDNKNATGQPKSAGASLRRYNETTYVQHVTDIVDLWRTEIDRSHLILYRASGPYNRSILFSGKTPLLNRNDCRLRTIPFSTRRATFKEVKRVHDFLSNIYVYSSAEIASKKFTTQKSPEQVKVKKSNSINRSKSRERTLRPDPFPKEDDSEVDSNTKISYSIEDVEIDFHEELKSFDDSLTQQERRMSPKKHKKDSNRKSKNSTKKEQLDEKTQLKKHICNLIKTGNFEEFKQAFDVPDNEKRTKLINDGLDDNNNTPLHIASIHEQLNFVSFLLENDADVCAKNDKNFTPYTCMQHKEIRDLFKDFAQKNPDKHNYNKANIPINNLTTEEQVERKRMQRKIKRDKEKEKKKEKELQKQEQLEKDRFLNLSDREKRALAAERRILKESGPMVLVRCFLCGTDISGKVPFEYSGNRFCSIDCLKAHRLRHCVKL